MEKTLGARIAFHRKRLGMTQDKLAEHLGVTAQAVSKWENDQSCPDITTLPRLADLFGISTDELLGRPQAHIVHETEVINEDDRKESKGFSLQWDIGKLYAIVLALWVMLVGGLSAANVIAQWGVGFWDILWPASLLMIGVAGLMKHFNFFNTGCILFGAYFLVDNLGIWHLDLGKELVFPIIIVLFGLFLLIDALRKPKKPHFKFTHGKHSYDTSEKKKTVDYSEDGEHFDFSLSFGEASRTITLPRLSSADLDCSFGELTVDLSGCGQIADRCHIDADCSFGELIIKVPSQYQVESSSDTSCGSFQIKGHHDTNPVGIILLNADVSFGDITVKYI